MKIDPLFKRLVLHDWGSSEQFQELVNEWRVLGCPVVEEPSPEFGCEIHDHDPHNCLACSKRWVDLRETKLALAAANARIKELENQQTLHIKDFSVFGNNVRNEALEEAADMADILSAKHVAKNIRGMKK